MKVVVDSDDSRIFNELDEFARLSNDEYERAIKTLPMRAVGVTGRVPKALGMIAWKTETGVELDIPFGIPEIEMVRVAFEKIFGRRLGEPKWMEKMALNVTGYLNSKDVCYSNIRIVE